MILLAVAIPVLLLGTKYVVERRSFNAAKIEEPRSDEVYKRCAREVALAVARQWNPGLS
jgi:hypothetical protein